MTSRVPLAVNVEQAAELIGKSTWTVRNYIKNGQLRARRPTPNAPWIIPMTAIDEFLGNTPEAPEVVEA